MVRENGWLLGRVCGKMIIRGDTFDYNGNKGLVIYKKSLFRLHNFRIVDANRVILHRIPPDMFFDETRIA